LGLYQGVPLTDRNHGYGLVAPDTITLFQGPIEAECSNMDEIGHVVRHTVIHELAHHFGINDNRLRELGVY
jgi:predicted Zn-dependent protease with MMP-like domain